MNRFDIALKKKPQEQITNKEIKDVFESARSLNYNHCANKTLSTNSCKYLFRTNSTVCKHGAGHPLYGNTDYGPCPHYTGPK
jgi:hypothetical protein